jgi:hypothetical protein
VTGAGLFFIAVGLWSLGYLLVRRRRLRQDQQRERDMPFFDAVADRKVAAELPFSLWVAVQVVVSLGIVAFGVWVLAFR